MNPEALQFIQKAGQFAVADQKLISEVVVFKSLKKDELLLNQGDICSQFSLILEGALYQYQIDTDLNENIIDLKVPGDWILDHQSFTTRKPAQTHIKAYEESRIAFLHIDDIHALIAKSQAFLQMGKILQEATSRLSYFDNQYTPDEKYQYLIDKSPLILQKYPQKMIASFLKITPETLSRVRSRLSKS